jgi:transcriptional regulatory protein LevR
MDFDERLGILRDGKVISSEIESLVRRVISRFQARWDIVLTEENGDRMITHLAMALMRIARQEKITALEKDMLEEFRNANVFPRSMEIVEDLIAWTPMELPEVEKDYMVVNVCLILDAKNDS